MHLVDYKVRVINSEAGTAARIRVFIESQDEHDVWGTVGVSENIIEASWMALVDAFEYKLCKDEMQTRVSDRQSAHRCHRLLARTAAHCMHCYGHTFTAERFPNDTTTGRRAAVSASGRSRATSTAEPNPAAQP